MRRSLFSINSRILVSVSVLFLSLFLSLTHTHSGVVSHSRFLSRFFFLSLSLSFSSFPLFALTHTLTSHTHHGWVCFSKLTLDLSSPLNLFISLSLSCLSLNLSHLVQYLCLSPLNFSIACSSFSVSFISISSLSIFHTHTASRGCLDSLIVAYGSLFIAYYVHGFLLMLFKEKKTYLY